MARRFDLVVRLADEQRGPVDLASVRMDTPLGAMPLSAIADVEEGDGPNQIGRENGRRRIVVYANTDGSDMGRIVGDIRKSMNAMALPQSYFISMEGQFQAQEQATRLIAILSLVSLALIFLVLYSRYRSGTLALIIMANIPFALVGSVLAVDRGSTAVGGLHGGLHHADWHRHAQRHSQGQPLPEPVPLRGRAL